ncbi:MAG: fasciclin domain-containing protein [Gammaproteobacteria bacterium]
MKTRSQSLALPARPAWFANFAYAFLALVLFAVASGASAGSYGKHAQKDIVDTAASAGSFNTLVAAVKAAGLVDTLKGDGPFTVFAPTDEAFAKLPPGQLEALLKDKAALTKVLTYHVVPGRVTSAQVVNLSSAKTVEGQSIRIAVADGVKVDDANVIKTDILASNGVIHVIDRVILPD